MYLPDDLRFTDLVQKKVNERLSSENDKNPYSRLLKEVHANVQNRLAENTSLQSALPMKFSVPENCSSFNLMAWWITLNIVYPDLDYFKSIALEEILQTAIQRYREGNEYTLWSEFIWFFFNEKNLESSIPENNPYSLPDILEFCLDHFSRDDIYGNMARKVAQYIESSPRLFNLRRKKSRVRRPQRKRGYNDKGSRRPTWSVPVYRFNEQNVDPVVLREREYRKLLRNSIRTLEVIEKGTWYLYPSGRKKKK